MLLQVGTSVRAVVTKLVLSLKLLGACHCDVVVVFLCGE